MLMIWYNNLINNKYFIDALTLFIRLFTSAARYQLSWVQGLSQAHLPLSRDLAMGLSNILKRNNLRNRIDRNGLFVGRKFFEEQNTFKILILKFSQHMIWFVDGIMN